MTIALITVRGRKQQPYVGHSSDVNILPESLVTRHYGGDANDDRGDNHVAAVLSPDLAVSQ